LTIPDLGLGLLEVVARKAIVCVAIRVILRAAGKRQVGQLSILELVSLLMTALRQHDVTAVGEVSLAVLEASGGISVIPVEPPVTNTGASSPG